MSVHCSNSDGARMWFKLRHILNVRSNRPITLKPQINTAQAYTITLHFVITSNHLLTTKDQHIV